MHRGSKAKVLIKISKHISLLTLAAGVTLSLAGKTVQPTTGTVNPKDVSLM
jgi:hypothetical protein